MHAWSHSKSRALALFLKFPSGLHIEWRVKVLARLCSCSGLPEPLLFEYVTWLNYYVSSRFLKHLYKLKLYYDYEDFKLATRGLCTFQENTIFTFEIYIYILALVDRYFGTRKVDISLKHFKTDSVMTLQVYNLRAIAVLARIPRHILIYKYLEFKDQPMHKQTNPNLSWARNPGADPVMVKLDKILYTCTCISIVIEYIY